jgi:hypothetical protein
VAGSDDAASRLAPCPVAATARKSNLRGRHIRAVAGRQMHCGRLLSACHRVPGQGSSVHIRRIQSREGGQGTDSKGQEGTCVIL